MRRPPVSPSPRDSRLSSWVAVLLLTAATVFAYRTTFSVPFVFDDNDAIVRNPTIRHLWPLWAPLSPPAGGGTTAGRPLVNLSLAINRACGGLAVHGYHAVNLGIHLAAGLTLFGLVRRTLRRPALAPRFGLAATELGFAVAAVWMLHPLQTESVTYVIQRAEALVGFFYLFALYAFVRGTSASRPTLWFVLSVAACALGMASKEVMVSAPLLVLCYDRAFGSGSFRSSLERHRWLYVGLGSTWLLLAWLLVGMGGSRGTSAGFGQGVAWWSYALAQGEAIVLYLRLSIWPHPLVFDYGLFPVSHVRDAVLPVIATSALALGGVVTFARNRAAGFGAAFFFAVLAPSSSIVPITTQTIAEHRMYLPLAAVVALAVAGSYALLGSRTLIGWSLVALGCALLTWQRNEDYRSATRLWHDTTIKRPQNARAFDNYAQALSEQGRFAEALPQFEQALRLNPSSASSHEGAAATLFQLGDMLGAQKHYEAILQTKPNSAAALSGLASIHYRTGNAAAAAMLWQEALRLDPASATTARNLAGALFQSGKIPDAIARYEEAIHLDPGDAQTHSDFAAVALTASQPELALSHAREAIRLNPQGAAGYNNLAAILIRLGQPAEALRYAEAAVRLDPQLLNAHYNLGEALRNLGQLTEAMRHFQAELHRHPDHVGANFSLGNILLQMGRSSDALAPLEKAARGNPPQPAALNSLGVALLRLQRYNEAAQIFSAGLRLDPDNSEVQRNLELATRARP